MTLRVNNCRATPPRQWLLHPQKLPRHSFATAAVKGQMRTLDFTAEAFGRPRQRGAREKPPRKLSRRRPWPEHQRQLRRASTKNSRAAGWGFYGSGVRKIQTEKAPGVSRGRRTEARNLKH